MGLEFRVVGPPGVGKTTYLARQALRAVEKYGNTSVVAVSLTRTAAAEIAGRKLPIPRNQIGTLHSLCYHTIGSGYDIAETKISEWNGWVKDPAMILSDKSGDLDTPYDERPDQETLGDRLFQEVNLLRARMIKESEWTPLAKEFYKKWTMWKKENDLIDFTDMIEIAWHDIEYPPFAPNVLLGDECQDWSRLELSLMRKWGKYVDRFILVGDPDQSLYAWRGADSYVFMYPEVPLRQKIVLKQSYRVPKKIHEFALRYINTQVQEREPVEYYPTKEEGELRYIPYTYKQAEFLIEDMEKYLKADKSIMVIASCGYMLDPLIAVLKKEGIPFHNPYRTKNRHWNPLKHGSKKQITVVDRLLAFLSENPENFNWTGQEIIHWAEHLEARRVFNYGMKDKLKLLDPKKRISVLELMNYFIPDELFKAHNRDLDWFKSNLLKSKEKLYEFPIRIVKNLGKQSLEKTPQITVGTIHSVKGGEAEIVYLIPDLSGAGMKEYLQWGLPRDSVCRMAYVGLTRAKETLILCGRATSWAINFNI